MRNFSAAHAGNCIEGLSVDSTGKELNSCGYFSSHIYILAAYAYLDL